MPDYQIVHLSFLEIVVPLALCITIIFLFIVPGKSKRSAYSVDKRIDWSVPGIDIYADGHSLFHTWDPRFKIFTMTAYSFLVVSLDTILMSTVALIVSLFGLVISGLPWERSLRRIKAMSGFLVMFLVVLPFTVKGRPGETLVIIGGLTSFPFHLSGFWTACTIVIKASAIALLMEPIFSTTSFPVILLAVSRLGMPVVICQMILLSHRYIHVFLQEMRRMYRGMKVRGFRKRTDLETMRSLGNLLGMLVVRSFDRTQRVYDAMLSRGYSGVFPTYTVFNAKRSDWHKCLFWLFLGGVLLLCDLNQIL